MESEPTPEPEAARPIDSANPSDSAAPPEPEEQPPNDLTKRFVWLKIVLGLAMLSGLALSWKLWIADRAFPTVPAAPWIPQIPPPFDRAVLVLLALAVLVAMVARRPRLPMLVVVGIGILLPIFDQNRLQPWFYQYVFMFATLSALRWRSVHDEDAKARTWAICAFIVAVIYFWSGIQKSNVSFQEEVVPWLLEPFQAALGKAGTEWATKLMNLGGPVECLIGILLFIPRTRTLGILGACAMHFLMLGLLGPFGLKYNTVVWPWNIAMALMVVILFWRNRRPVLGPVIRGGPFAKLVFIVLGLFPWLSFANLWDAYLSDSLYSQNILEGYIVVPGPSVEKLPESWRHYAEPYDGFNVTYTLSSWSLDELNVPLYPERRLYHDIVRQFRERGIDETTMVLYVRPRPKFNSNDRPWTVEPVGK